MSQETPEPLVIRSQSWYKKQLDYEVLIYEPDQETHVAKITLNRPDKMNALSFQLLAELFHALKVAEQDTEINAIVIKGAGRCFSATHDAHASCRSMAQTMAMGQAVGTAAALSLKTNCSARALPIPELQAQLSNAGAGLEIPGEVAAKKAGAWRRNRSAVT